MIYPTGKFARDASNRLCYEVFDLDASDFPQVVSRIVNQFNLESTSDLVVGVDQLFCCYSDGERSVELAWDNWSGFFVTANSSDAEELVRAFGSFLSDALRAAGSESLCR